MAEMQPTYQRDVAKLCRSQPGARVRVPAVMHPERMSAAERIIQLQRIGRTVADLSTPAEVKARMLRDARLIRAAGSASNGHRARTVLTPGGFYDRFAVAGRVDRLPTDYPSPRSSPTVAASPRSRPVPSPTVSAPTRPVDPVIAKAQRTLRRWQLRRQALAVSGSLSERLAARNGGPVVQVRR